MKPLECSYSVSGNAAWLSQLGRWCHLLKLETSMPCDQSVALWGICLLQRLWGVEDCLRGLPSLFYGTNKRLADHERQKMKTQRSQSGRWQNTKVTDVEKRRSHTDLGNTKRLPFGKWEHQCRTCEEFPDAKATGSQGEGKQLTLLEQTNSFHQSGQGPGAECLPEGGSESYILQDPGALPGVLFLTINNL